MLKQLAARVLQEGTGETARDVTPLTGGQVGRVYRVDSLTGSFVVKFVTSEDELPFAEEPADDRVYGSRWSNLRPAHQLLAAHGIAAPALYATGDIDAKGLRYAIMAYLSGDPDDYSRSWFSAVGKALGELHTITRDYQGWTALNRPLADDWSMAFRKSFDNCLLDAKPLLEPGLYEITTARIGGLLHHLEDPRTFVLSHTDCFQGILKKSDSAWNFLGHVDIEDFQYTDQRLVLAGFELSHAVAGRSVPTDFWGSYGAVVDLAPDYLQFRDLFQTYYLLVWINVLQGQVPLFEVCRHRLEAMAR